VFLRWDFAMLCALRRRLRGGLLRRFTGLPVVGIYRYIFIVTQIFNWLFHIEETLNLSFGGIQLMKLRKIFAVAIACFTLLSFAGLESGAVDTPATAGNSTESTASDAPKKTSPVAKKSVDDGVDLVLDTQEYGGGKNKQNILELLEFSAARSTSSEIRKQIMMINSDIDATVGRDTRLDLSFEKEPDVDDIFEVKAYPMISDRYIQLIETSVDFPTTYDPDIYSFVYNRGTHKYMHLSDALIMDGLTEDGIISAAETLYGSQVNASNDFRYGCNDYLYGGKVCGFYMTGESSSVRHYILKMHHVSLDGETRNNILIYTPKTTPDGTETLSAIGDWEQALAYGSTFMSFNPALKCAALDTSVAPQQPTEDTHDEIPLILDQKYNYNFDDYIKFLKDGTVVIHIDGKTSVSTYAKNGAKIDINNPDGDDYEGVLSSGGEYTEPGWFLTFDISGTSYELSIADRGL
jgi:hypothetical protein